MNCIANPLVPIADRIPTWGGVIDDRCWTELEPCSAQELERNIAYVKAAHADLAEFAPGEQSMEAFAQLVALLKRENIQAAVVLVPQSPAMRQLYAPCFRESRQAAQRRHHIQVVNAFDWLEEEQFRDCIHPVASGAQEFCARITNDVLLAALR